MKRILAALVLALSLPAMANAQPAETLTIASGDKTHTVKAEAAASRAAAETRLTGRSALPAGEGFLIDYGKVGGSFSSTMKGVAFDLDILFLAGDGTIVAMIQHARAGSLRPLYVGLGATATLQLPSGQVAALGIKTGDKVTRQAGGNGG